MLLALNSNRLFRLKPTLPPYFVFHKAGSRLQTLCTSSPGLGTPALALARAVPAVLPRRTHQRGDSQPLHTREKKTLSVPSQGRFQGEWRTRSLREGSSLWHFVHCDAIRRHWALVAPNGFLPQQKPSGMVSYHVG